MNTRMRRAAVAVAAVAMAALPRRLWQRQGGRRQDRGVGSGAAKGDAIKIGLLLPENQTARYEKFDKPLIEKKIAELHRRQGQGRLRQRQAGRDHAERSRSTR